MGSSCNKYRSTVSSFEPSLDGDKKCGITDPSFQIIDGKDASNEIQSDNKIGNDLGINEKTCKDHEKDIPAPEMVANASEDGSGVQSGTEDISKAFLETEGITTQDASHGDTSQDITSSDAVDNDQQINTAADTTQVDSDDLFKPTELPDNTPDSPRVDNDADLDSGMEYDEDDDLPTDNDQKKSGDNNAHRGTRTSYKMSGIGELEITKPAPDFEATAVVNGEFKTIKLSDYRGKYVVIFFYPLDFTFVCPTEIIAFSEKADDFRAIDCEVLGCSTDSVYSHLAWVNTPRKMGGLGPMNVPLIGDKTLEIARKYGCLKEDEGVAFRGLYIIDDKGNLRQITINDLPVGRSVDETLRLVQAFQFTDKHGEVCPAGWKPGKDTMKPDPNASKEYFGKAH